MMARGQTRSRGAAHWRAARPEPTPHARDALCPRGRAATGLGRTTRTQECTSLFWSYSPPGPGLFKLDCRILSMQYT